MNPKHRESHVLNLSREIQICISCASSHFLLFQFTLIKFASLLPNLDSLYFVHFVHVGSTVAHGLCLSAHHNPCRDLSERQPSSRVTWVRSLPAAPSRCGSGPSGPELPGWLIN